MALISSTVMLQHARKNKYCIPAFNVYSVDMLRAVSEAAYEMQSPVIIQTSINRKTFGDAAYLASAAKTAAEQLDIPISLHLDHCNDMEIIVWCMAAGYTSVMIDASHLPFDENVARTKQVVALAKQKDINTEAELGRLLGVEDDVQVGEENSELADPELCKRFVELTDVDSLAPAIGTAHGIYVREPSIDFARIVAIASIVSIPLVLHGGSSLPDEQVKRCIELGMSKLNIATELRHVFTKSLREVLENNPDDQDPRNYLPVARDALKQFCKTKMVLCQSAGKSKYVK